MIYKIIINRETNLSRRCNKLKVKSLGWLVKDST